MRTTTRTRICRRRKDQPNWFSHRVLWRRLPSVTLAETFSASFELSKTSGGPNSQRELNTVQTLLTTEASMKPSRQCTALHTRCRVLCTVRRQGAPHRKDIYFDPLVWAFPDSLQCRPSRPGLGNPPYPSATSQSGTGRATIYGRAHQSHRAVKKSPDSRSWRNSTWDLEIWRSSATQ